MAASKARQTATKTQRPPTARQAAIIATANQHPDLSERNIATLTDTDPAQVHRTLKAYKIERDRTDQFKNYRADIFAGFQSRILASISDAEIKKSPFGSKILSVCQLYDKERLERGQSTDNVNVLVAGLRDLQSRKRGVEPVDK